MGAQPKQRISKARQGRRRNHHKVVAPALTRCPRCGESRRAQHVCPNCGTYGGVQVVEPHTGGQAAE